MTGEDRDDYRQARVGAGSAFVAVLCTLLLWDALSSTYEVDPMIVGAILGAIAALMGVEIIRGNR